MHFEDGFEREAENDAREEYLNSELESLIEKGVERGEALRRAKEHVENIFSSIAKISMDNF